jgi:hypothetical protein
MKFFNRKPEGDEAQRLRDEHYGRDDVVKRHIDNPESLDAILFRRRPRRKGVESYRCDITTIKGRD